MQAEFVVVVVIVALAAAGRIWHLAFAYRLGVERTRERRRARAERELFDRLERCMESSAVE